MNYKKDICKKDIIFFIGLLIVGIFLIWKVRYGAEGYDEAFYLTIPYRMVKGDILFINEWHGSQLSAFILYPFVKLYLLIFKSTEGIILFFRYLYVAVNTVVSIVAYLRLRQFGISGAIGVLLYYIFVPFNISALSYNSMGYMFVLLSSVFIATNFNNSKASFLVSGIFFAGAVLCQPVLALFFFVAAVAIFIISALKKNISYAKSFGLFAVGCAVPAMPIVIYIFSKIGLYNFVSSFKMITADPEHNQSLMYSLYSMYISYYEGAYVYTGISFIILLSISLILVKFKKKNFFPVVLSFVPIIWFVYKIISYSSFSLINVLYLPIGLSGIIAVFGIKDKKIERYFFISLLFSIAHAISFITSNQYKFVMTPALMPTYVASIIVCRKLIEENRSEVKNWVRVIYKVGMAVSLSVVVMLTAYYRYEGIFSYSGQTTVKEMTVQMNAGCYSGIMASEGSSSNFNKFKIDFDRCNFTRGDEILILSARIWLSLENKGGAAQYSAWLAGIDRITIERLNEYYSLNPDKKPNYVYICKDEVQKYNYDVKEWAEENKCKLRETDSSYVICL